MQKSNKRLAIAVLVAFFLLIVYVIFSSYGSYAKTATLDIQVAPAESTITLNGAKTTAGSVRVRPGTYSVKVSFSGFASVTRSVKATKNQTTYVGVVLESNAPSTTNWYADHASDNQLVQTISGKNFDEEGAEQTKELPLIKDLPHIDLEYRIDYGPSLAHPNDPAAVAIHISYYDEAGKEQALQWITFKGYDPSKLEILYTPLPSPF